MQGVVRFELHVQECSRFKSQLLAPGGFNPDPRTASIPSKFLEAREHTSDPSRQAEAERSCSLFLSLQVRLLSCMDHLPEFAQFVPAGA